MKCSFCKSEIPAGTGIEYVLKNGKILYFCSSKCRKNMLVLKRKSVKFKWARKQK